MFRRFLLVVWVGLWVNANAIFISCFINFKGSCGGGINVGFDLVAYASRYNKFIDDCGFGVVNKTMVYVPEVVDKKINFDCEGQSGIFDANYSFYKSCDTVEIFSVENECIVANTEKYMTNIWNDVPLTFIIYNMPPICSYGLGTMDPDSTFHTVWIQQNRLKNVNYTSTLAHELGHTHNLQHAGAFGSEYEYSDCGCPMGCATDINVCYNAPNAHRLGWASPIAIGGQTRFNIWSQVFVPIYTTSPYNHILVHATDDCDLFFSVRSSLGGPGDQGIRDFYGVNIHKEYIPVENALSIHAMNKSSGRSMVVDYIPYGSTWDFQSVSDRVCGANTKNVAIMHSHFSKERKGSDILICFYNVSFQDCL